MTTQSELERVAKPDCACCGQPYHRHNIGAITTCPIIATYRPRAAQSELERVRDALRRSETEGFSPDIEQIFMDDLPTLLNAIEVIHDGDIRDQAFEEAAAKLDKIKMPTCARIIRSLKSQIGDT